MGKPGASRRRRATGPSGPASCQRRPAAIPLVHSSALTPPKVLMRMMLRQAPKNRIGQDRASGVRCLALSAEYKAKALSGMGKTMP